MVRLAVVHVDACHRKESARLRVSVVDADEAPELAEKLKITEIPTLVLIKDGRPVARLEGRASEPQIRRTIAPYFSKSRTRVPGGIVKQSSLPALS
jgi:thioredoxin-like negative regulator of GroEL